MHQIKHQGLGDGYDSGSITIKEGPISLTTGQDIKNKDAIFTGDQDWTSPYNDNLWNEGTYENPIKTLNDPCPDGWRVPTYNELSELQGNHSSWTKNAEGRSGYWFSGTRTYAEGVPQIFLPAAGFRDLSDGVADARGDTGHYFSSRSYSSYACRLAFGKGSIVMGSYYRARGYSVRCVQE